MERRLSEKKERKSREFVDEFAAERKQIFFLFFFAAGNYISRRRGSYVAKGDVHGRRARNPYLILAEYPRSKDRVAREGKKYVCIERRLVRRFISLYYFSRRGFNETVLRRILFATPVTR